MSRPGRRRGLALRGVVKVGGMQASGLEASRVEASQVVPTLAEAALGCLCRGAPRGR